MKISVNNKIQEIPEQATLSEVLTAFDQPKIGVAVAINQMIVPKDQWDSQEIIANDDILIIQATQGG